MVRRAIIAQQLVCASLRFGVMVRNYLALNYFANHKRSGRASEVVSSQLSFFFLSLKTRNWYSRWRNESKTEEKTRVSYSAKVSSAVHLRRYCFRNDFLFIFFAALDGTGEWMTLPLFPKEIYTISYAFFSFPPDFLDMMVL